MLPFELDVVSRPVLLHGISSVNNSVCHSFIRSSIKYLQLHFHPVCTNNNSRTSFIHFSHFHILVFITHFYSNFIFHKTILIFIDIYGKVLNLILNPETPNFLTIIPYLFIHINTILFK
jgi:hypothetical protein